MLLLVVLMVMGVDNLVYHMLVLQIPRAAAVVSPVLVWPDLLVSMRDGAVGAVHAHKGAGGAGLPMAPRLLTVSRMRDWPEIG